MEIARLGVLFLPGDMLENVMPPERKEYPLLVAGAKGRFAVTDEIDFVEDNFNALKRVLLLTERIDPQREPYAALWIKRPENPSHGEVMVAGRALPGEGTYIQPLWPEILRAFAGRPTRWDRDGGETVYYPVRNSDEEIVGVLEVTEHLEPLFV
ncbi:hypothetical protein MJA45_05015 [Paenibacillus aurantius]|uniref:Uncharacterized protein n=1 Tax=Paenibacillus aurantius TaxID=2918900 RepID=A0AA96LFP7_9BACL|nr:hypothetical protein [Paenibacillus aurantius]WNQ12413.1 hypothetical protein MJA45_05015 [Paenibacillus aurantius]